MNQEIDTFESICAGSGEPIEVFDIISPPERDIRCGKFIPSPDPVRVGIWKLPDDVEGGIMVCGTYHTGAPFQWHYNCGERSAVAHLLADRDRLRSELDAARAELARVRKQLLRRMGDAAMEKAKALEVAMNKERERRGKKWPSDVMRAFRRLNRMHGAVEAILRAEELARMGTP